MTDKLKLSEILEATRGVLQGAAGQVAFEGLSIDSRNVRQGELFVALKGPHFDGHQFVSEAFVRGARGAVVMNGDRGALGLDARSLLIQVEDGHQALRDLAIHRRLHTSARIAAITGSNGKTTTKDLLACCCSSRGETVASHLSYNNDIGVPLTLVRLGSRAKYGIVEVGTNAPGEIASLTAMVRPDVAVLTQIASAHLEGLRDVQGVAREKQALLTSVSPGGTVIVNGDDDWCLRVAEQCQGDVQTFGERRFVDHRAERIRPDAQGTTFIYNGTLEVRIPFPGAFHVSNALAALAAASALGISPLHGAKALEKATPPPMRFNVQSISDVTVVNDAYNANPRSVRTALNEIQNFGSKGRKVAVLGAMRELGSDEIRQHEAVGRFAAERVDHIVAVGAPAANILNGARKSGFPRGSLSQVANPAEACLVLKPLLRPGDVVLIKGSRSERLDRVADGLEMQSSSPPQSEGGRAVLPA